MSESQIAHSPLEVPESRSDHDVIAIEHAADGSAKFVLVEWMLGNTCTYACSYCPEHLHDGSEGWIDLKSIYEFLDQLDHHYQRRFAKKVWLHYTGGEPTVYPDFRRLIRACAIRGFKQSVTSNGVRSLSFWEQAVQDLDFVVLTFHVEFAKEDHFKAVIDLLRQHIPVHVNITMLPDKFEFCSAFASEIREMFDSITINLKPLRVEFRQELYPYTQEQLEFLKTPLRPRQPIEAHGPRSVMAKTHRDGSRHLQRANLFILNQENTWHGWHCAAGLERLYIVPDGTIYSAVCRVGGPIGNVGEAVTFPEQYAICPHNTCNCISDILLTKLRWDHPIVRQKSDRPNAPVSIGSEPAQA